MSAHTGRYTLKRLFLEVSILALVAAMGGTIGRHFGPGETTAFFVQILPVVLAWGSAKYVRTHQSGLLAGSVASIFVFALVAVDTTRMKNPLYVIVGLALSLAIFAFYYLLGKLVAKAERWLAGVC